MTGAKEAEDQVLKEGRVSHIFLFRVILALALLLLVREKTGAWADDQAAANEKLPSKCENNNIFFSPFSSSKTEADKLALEADLRRDQGDIKAEELLRMKAIKAAGSTGIPANIFLRRHWELALFYARTKQYNKARRAFEKASDPWSATNAPALSTESKAVRTKILKDFGEFLDSIGEKELALVKLSMAEALAQQIKDCRAKVLVVVLLSTGIVYRSHKDYRASEKALRRALDLFDPGNFADEGLLVRVLLELTETLILEERFNEAENVCQRALTIQRKISDDSKAYSIVGKLASIQVREGKIAESCAAMEQLLECFNDADESRFRIIDDYLQTMVQSKKNMSLKDEDFLRHLAGVVRANGIRRKEPHVLLQACFLQNLIDAKRAKNVLEKLAARENGLEKVVARLGASSWWSKTTLDDASGIFLDLCNCERWQHKFTECETHCREFEKLLAQRKPFTKDRSSYNTAVLFNQMELALCMLEQGKFARAKEEMKQSDLLFATIPPQRQEMIRAQRKFLLQQFIDYECDLSAPLNLIYKQISQKKLHQGEQSLLDLEAYFSNIRKTSPQYDLLLNELSSLNIMLKHYDQAKVFLHQREPYLLSRKGDYAGKSEKLIRVYKLFAQIGYYQHNLSEVETNLKKCASILRQAKHEQVELSANRRELAQLYIFQNRLSEARELSLESLLVANEISSIAGSSEQAASHSLLGAILKQEHKLQQACDEFRKSADTYESLGSNFADKLKPTLQAWASCLKESGNEEEMKKVDAKLDRLR